MPRKFIIAAIAAALALVACSEEIQKPEENPVASDNVHTLSVGIEAGAYVPVEGETKASMEAIIRVRWQQNDEVSVVNATTGKILGGCLKATQEGTVVTFEGTVTGEINAGDNLYYIYPRVAQNTEEVTFAGYNVSLASQTYDAQNPGNVCFYGYAEDVATGTSTEISKKIQFNLVTSYAHFNMASLPAKGVSLSSVDISNVNGGFTWTLSGNTLTAEPYEVNGGISVRCNADISASGNAIARFAIPASEASEQDRVITVNKAYTTNFSKIALPASSYYNLLYSSWTKKTVTVDQTDTEKNKVDISNDESKETAEGAIPTSAFESTGLDNKTTEIKMGGVGKVIFDDEATAAVKTNAGSSTEVFFKVEDVTTTKPVENADVVYEVTMKTLDQDGKEVFNEVNANGKVTIIIPLEEDVVFIRMVTLVDDDGTSIDGGVVEDSIELDLDKHTLTFQVEHFSKYAVGYVKRADFISVTGVSLNKNAVTLPVEGTETLVATVAPDNATNNKVTWTSSNTNVATVDKDGKVTAVAFGQATITVTTEDGGFTDNCVVTVTETKTMAELLATNPDIPEVGDLTPPAGSWINSSDPACKAFIGVDKDGYKLFTAVKIIPVPGTGEDKIINFGLLMEDTFDRTDENTYTHIEDGIVTVIAKMENGKFISCEFIFGDWLIQYDPDMAYLAGTYAPSSAPSQSPTETTPEQTVF